MRNSRIRPSRVLIAARKRREAREALPGAQDVEEIAAAPVGDDAEWLHYAHADAQRYGYEIRSDDPVPPRSAGHGEYYRWRTRQQDHAWRERHKRDGEPDALWGLNELMQYGLRRGLRLPDPTDESTLTDANFNFARLYRDIVKRQAEERETVSGDAVAAYEKMHAAPVPTPAPKPVSQYVPAQPDIHATSVSTSTLRKIDRAFDELQRERPFRRITQAAVAKHLGISTASVSKAKEVCLAECARLGIRPPAWASRPPRGAGRRRK